MRKTISFVGAVLLLLAPVAHAACPDGSVGPVCFNVTGPVMVQQINNAFANFSPTNITPNSVIGSGTAPSLTNMNLNGVFYPDAYGASGSTATISVNTTANSNQITCASGCGDFKAGHGIAIPAAGPTTVGTAVPASMPTPTCTGSCSGAHTYKYITLVADPSGGIGPGSAVSPTLSSAPAITALGPGAHINMACTGVSKNYPVIYLTYRSYDSGTYTLMQSDTGCGLNGSADYGQIADSKRQWPATISGTGYAGQRDTWFGFIASINGSVITANDSVTPNVLASLTGATMSHDDTLAAQAAEVAAEASGGGTLQFGPHSYNLKRPAYRNLGSQAWTRDITLGPGGGGPHVYIESSNINVAGSGMDATTLIGGPDGYNIGQLFGVGAWRDPAYGATSYAMNTVNRGDTSITLVTAANTSHFAIGDDVMMFFGATGAGGTCTGSGGFAGCNWEEANTITSIDSTNGILYLRYPANKTYYSDASSNPFGVVDIPGATTALPGNQAFKHLSFHDFATDSPSGLMVEGFGTPLDDVSIYNLNLATGASGPIIYSAFGRNWDIHNNRITIGNSSTQHGVQEEVDRAADWTVHDNIFKTNSTLTAFGTFLNLGIGLSEGASNMSFVNNKFYGVNLTTDCGSNNITITNNQFTDSQVALGALVADGCNIGSFGTPSGWTVANNSFFGMVNASTCLLNLKNVAHGVSVTGNVLDSRSTDLNITNSICVSSGSVSGNTIHVMGTNGGGNYGVQVVPQAASSPGIPALPVSVIGNTMTGGATFSRGVNVTDPGSAWGGLITIGGNIENVNNVSDTVASIADTPNVIDFNLPSQTSGGIGVNPSPTYLFDLARSPQVIFSAAGTAIYTCNSANAHKQACVSDETSACTRANTYASGGSNKCAVNCDGTNWKITGAGCF